VIDVKFEASHLFHKRQSCIILLKQKIFIRAYRGCKKLPTYCIYFTASHTRIFDSPRATYAHSQTREIERTMSDDQPHTTFALKLQRQTLKDKLQ
jgi:hypothetical protein